MPIEDFNKIHTKLTELCVNIARLEVRLASMGDVFVSRKDCEQHRDKCRMYLDREQSNDEDRWYKLTIELVKLLGAAIAGGAVGSKILS